MSNCLIDHTYANDRLGLIFYDEATNKFRLWQEPTQQHFSYSYMLNEDGLADNWLIEMHENDDFLRQYRGADDVTLYHPRWHRNAKFKQIFFANPNDVRTYMGGDEFFENHLKYYARFAMDKRMAFGMPYNILPDNKIQRIKITRSKPEKKLARDLINLGFTKNMVHKVLDMLLAPIPKLSYIAMDMEVLTRGNVVPNPFIAAEPILSIAFKYSNDRAGLILSLDHKTRTVLKRKINPAVVEAVNKGHYTIEWFDDERELMKRANEVLMDPDYRVLITYNGDNFDLPYWKYRCLQFGIWTPLRHRNYVSPGGKVYNDIYIEPKDDNRRPDMSKWKLHFDMYKFLAQAYIKDYAFRGKYTDNRLGTIAQALLGYGKIEYEGSINDLTLHDLVHYNFRDVEILDDLMKMQGGVIPAMVFLLMRLGYEPFGDCHRKAISSKIGNLIQAWVTERRWISPRRMDLRAVDDAEFERLDKLGVETSLGQTKYKGATVLDPMPGYYFDVECRDFTGLYTNIIHGKNLSFETLCCGHPECSSNIVPEIQHYVCIRDKGLVSEIVGLITTARRLYFKPEAKNNEYYSPIEQVLKVFGNASYGVLGAGFFGYYLRILAESTTAYSRDALGRVIAKAIELGMQVIYGDTDSIFLINFIKETMQQLVDWTMENLQLELNLDYDLQFFTISKRKKNYLGIKRDGTPLVAGFKIKKRNSPGLVSQAGNKVIGYLSRVHSEKDLRTARGKIIFALRQVYTQIWNKEGELPDYAFTMQIRKRLKDYKVMGIHVRAAIMEAESIIDDLPEGISATPEDIIQPGTLQSYVKCARTVSRTPSGRSYRVGVLPLSLAEKRLMEPSEYHKELKSSMSQIIDMLGITPNDYITRDPRKPALDEWLKVEA